MNQDFMPPAIAQDIAVAEPEEDENGGPYDNDGDDNYPDFNFATMVILDVVTRLREQ